MVTEAASLSHSHCLRAAPGHSQMLAWPPGWHSGHQLSGGGSGPEWGWWDTAGTQGEGLVGTGGRQMGDSWGQVEDKMAELLGS